MSSSSRASMRLFTHFVWAPGTGKVFTSHIASLSRSTILYRSCLQQPSWTLSTACWWTNNTFRAKGPKTWLERSYFLGSLPAFGKKKFLSNFLILKLGKVPFFHQLWNNDTWIQSCFFYPFLAVFNYLHRDGFIYFTFIYIWIENIIPWFKIWKYKRETTSWSPLIHVPQLCSTCSFRLSVMFLVYPVGAGDRKEHFLLIYKVYKKRVIFLTLLTFNPISFLSP